MQHIWISLIDHIWTLIFSGITFLLTKTYYKRKARKTMPNLHKTIRAIQKQVDDIL